MSLGATTSAPASTWLDGSTREELERLVVVDLAVAEHTAVAVARVLAEADVGDERQAGHLGTEGPKRALDDPVGLPGARAFLVLLLRDPEEEHGAHSERRELGRLPDDLVDRPLGDPVESVHRVHDPLAGTGEEWHHDVVERQPMSRARARAGCSVRRSRRSRVTGNAVIGWRVRQPSGSAAGSSRLAVDVPGTDVPVVPRLELDPLAKNSQIARDAAIVGNASRTPGEAVQLATRKQPEDDEQRMETQCVRHHVGHDDMALDLVDEDEERATQTTPSGCTTRA